MLADTLVLSAALMLLSQVAALDRDLVAWFKDMQKKGYLDNTIIVMNSDHGIHGKQHACCCVLLVFLLSFFLFVLVLSSHWHLAFLFA